MALTHDSTAVSPQDGSYRAGAKYRNTIKALEMRMKAAQENAARAMEVKNPITSPTAGIAHVLGAAFAGYGRGQAENQAADARNQLAQLLTKTDPVTNLPTQQTISEISQLDPERAYDLQDEMIRQAADKPEQWQDIATPAGQTGQWQRSSLSGELKRLGGAGEGDGPGEPKLTDISSMRSQVLGDESYVQAKNSLPIYESMLRSAPKGDRTSDLDLIYGLAKMLDPTGVVRGEDAVMISANSPISDIVKSWASGLSDDPKARLQPDVRKDIMALAYSRASSAANAYKEFSDWYRKVAERSGVNPDDVAPSFGEVRQWQSEDVPTITGDDDPAYQALPPGAEFIGPDGKRRRKQQ